MSLVILPALKGVMGDREYFLTVMKMGTLASEMNFASELHPHAELDRQIQRELSSRCSDIKDYLLRQEERFFGAIVAAVYGGNPKFYPVQMAEHFLLDGIDQGFGVLKFDGSQRYFALDGQHRLKAIQLAIKEKPELAAEDISVILVAHDASPEGEKRTRRLFTTLNRYAAPVALRDSVAMDEDDAIAVTTRRLIRECPLFSGEKIIIAEGHSLSPSNTKSFTNLLTLYACNELYLSKPDREIDKQYKQILKSDAVLEQLYAEATEFWAKLAANIDEIKRVWDAPPGANSVRGLRTNGGHLLFRPIGQKALCRAIRSGLNNGQTLDQILDVIKRVPMEIREAPWTGVIWHQGTSKMIARKENEDFVVLILEYYLGLHLAASVNQQYSTQLNSNFEGEETQYRIPELREA